MSNSVNHAVSVRFRGVRGSTPSPGKRTQRYGGNTACVEIRAAGEILILDAGTGIRALGTELLEEFSDRPVEATLLISHTHWDHIQGLPFFAPGFAAENSIRVLAAHGSGATVNRALRNQMTAPYFPVSLDDMRGLRPVEELKSAQDVIGTFSIETTALNHPGGCAGFRIEANGVCVAYLPDHEPFSRAYAVAPGSLAHGRRQALIDFVADADLLILDTQYTEAEYQQRIGWGHGSLPESVALATEAGVRELALFHHDPAHSDAQLDGMLASACALTQSSDLRVRAASEDETVTLHRGSAATLASALCTLVKRAAA